MQPETSPDGEPDVALDDFKQGFLAGWIHAQGWNQTPTFEQFSAAAVAWEGWLDSQQSTRQ